MGTYILMALCFIYATDVFISTIRRSPVITVKLFVSLSIILIVLLFILIGLSGIMLYAPIYLVKDLRRRYFSWRIKRLTSSIPYAVAMERLNHHYRTDEWMATLSTSNYSVKEPVHNGKRFRYHYPNGS